jgi:hypothetical protein
MDESKQQAIQFLEKEIKTYVALGLFLSKKDIRKHLETGDQGAFLTTAFYKERMKEAQRVVDELKKQR